MRTLQHRSKYNLGHIEAVNSKLEKRSVYMKNKKMRYFKITPHCGRFLKSQSLFIKSILPGKYISFSFGPTVRIHFNLINYNFTRKILVLLLFSWDSTQEIHKAICKRIFCDKLLHNYYFSTSDHVFTVYIILNLSSYLR